MDKLRKAIDYAIVAHGDQMYGKLPYSVHINAVVEVGKELGLDEELLCACALHDVLEDTKVNYTYLSANFGSHVAEIVYRVTDELGRNRKERKEKTYPKIGSSTAAILVKTCDRIANLRHSVAKANLLGMYVSEHEDFCRAFFPPEHHECLDKAWALLQDTFTQVTRSSTIRIREEYP